MLDIKLIREDTESVKAALAKVGVAPAEIDSVVGLDKRRRELIAEVESMRAERKKASKEIGKAGGDAAAEDAKAAVRALGERMGVAEAGLAEAEQAFGAAMLEIPNLPHPDVPEGKDETDNVEIRTVGDPLALDFEPEPHWEIGERLGIIDFERGVKVSGSRFYVLCGDGARLQRALINWMLDLHSGEHGYTEVYPPAMVRGDCLVGTGNLPKFGDNLYRDAEEDFYFVPTAEVPVTNLYRDEVLGAGQLPIKHVAYTPCFRREKMSAGRDVRGIKRGHQFDKVEMVKFVHPDRSDAELVSLLDDAEDVARRLGIRHRVVQMCTADLSFVAAIKYDVELWAPGSDEWLEVSSCSNFRDFQARRTNIRFKPAEGGRAEFVHTLNGSGLALPRVMIAVLENFQNGDGGITVPEVLRPYMGGQSTIA